MRPIRWTRPALVARLESFEQKFSGPELVEAVVSFADNLEPEDRELLQEVLLERADEQHVFEYALRRRVTEPKARPFRQRPQEPGHRPRRRRRR